MIKKDPIYRVTVYTQKETVIITSPITCQLRVTRNVHADSCTASVQLYNLAPSTRAEIFQDVFQPDPNTWKYLHIEAGYGGSYETMSLIFVGRILQAYSHKSGGATDIITEIQAQALDLLDCNTSHTFLAETSFKDIFATIAQDMPNCIIGNMGAIEGAIRTATTFDGNAFEELNKLTGGHTFIDNGVLNTIMDNEVIDVPVPVITDSTGLLETPVRRNASLMVKTLFEPTLEVCQLLEIESRVFPNYNGQYKVVGFTHNCLFSETQAGSRTTDLELLIGGLLPNATIELTDGKTQKNFNKVKGDKIQPVNEKAPASVREVYDYIKAHKGEIPNTQITKNISWREVLGNCNTNAERYSELNIGLLTNMYNTAQTLQRVLDKYYAGATIKINSGWRSKRNNTACGGVSNSKHMLGLAIDFKIPSQINRNVFNTFKSAWTFGWVGLYNTFVHVQINSTKGIANDK